MTHLFFNLFLSFLFAAPQKEPADLVVYNARIYTVDSAFTVADAMAIKDGKILRTGTSKNIRSQYEAVESLDAKGRAIFPGFIDAHSHFVEYGLGLQEANLVGTTSWHEVLKKLQQFAQTHPDGWIVGAGWDQNDWPEKEFPTNNALDSLFPDRPVFLRRIDGHAAIANTKALQRAGVKAGKTLTGGTVETKNGQLTGILIDNAVDLVGDYVPQPTPAQKAAALRQAEQNCIAMGLTTVTDCGLDYKAVLFIDSLQKQKALHLRLYAMLSDAPQNYAFAKQQGKIKTDALDVRAFKVYADGALGSRGACLLQPYADRAGWSGFLLSAQTHFDSVAQVIRDLDFQMCTHAIGDSGNRAMLNIYAKYLNGKNNKRWRIEHAQVVAHEDLKKFGENSIIPSVQPTHATSDMYWAGARLGNTRVHDAYAYQQLLQQNGWIPLGTDFPVESISPFKTFYAAVWRQDSVGYPKGGFQKEDALTREQALRGMTIWAARSNFEEENRGSLEPGKWADFVILDTDLMKADGKAALNAKVHATFIGGQKRYDRTAVVDHR